MENENQNSKVRPNSFYIGWMKSAPNDYRSFGKVIIVVLAILIVSIAGIIVLHQRGFSLGVYDHNQLTELEGVIITDPFPAIKTFYGKDIYGNPVLKTIALVNKGKFGADSLL